MLRLLLLLFLLIGFAESLASPFVFIKNEGQWPENVLYRTAIPSGQLWITDQGLLFQLYENVPHVASNANSRKTFSSQNIELKFKNLCVFSKKTVKPNQFFNFFIDNNSENWKSQVPAFEEVFLDNIYDGIDLRMYSTDQSLKYEYIVKPGADVNQIKLKYNGASEVAIQNKELVLKTAYGIIKEFQPFTYQVSENKKKQVPSAFIKQNDYIAFQIADYDKSKTLIIDPELVFSTFSGSNSDNWSHSATFDAKGNTYAAGTVFGINFPVSLNPAQPQAGGASNASSMGNRTDIVIIKYSPDGKEILYSTFLGGNESEVPISLIVNSKDQLIIFGTTSSSTFPVTRNSFDESFNGGSLLNGPPITTNITFFSGTDIFVTLLSENGDQLLGSTFVGGSENDGIHDYRALDILNYGDEFRGEVYADQNDNIYVASVSTSSNFPLVAPIQTKKSAYDAVVFKLSPDCNQMLYSTFVGGSNYDAAYGIRVDKAGAIYVCGATLSKDFPIGTSALKKSFGGDTEGFLMKIENQRISAATYIGTPKGDIAYFIDLDLDGNVFVLGSTTGEYPVSTGVYQNPKSGQFIHCFSNDLSSSKFSTVFGTGRQIGYVDIVPTAFMVNDCGSIYVSGWGGKINAENGYNKNSTTKGLPVTENAFSKTTSGSNYYFAIFEKELKSLLYGTFFGSNPPANPEDERGDHLDGGTCRFDKKGVIYHSACVCKSTGFVEFPLKNAVEPNHRNANCNMAAFKFDLDRLDVKFDLKDGSILNPEQVCAPAKIEFKNNTFGGDKFEWYINNQKISIAENINYTFADSGTYKVKLVAYSKITCKAVDSTIRYLKVIAFKYSALGDTTVCPGGTVSMEAKGGLKYQWTPASFFENNKLPIVSVKVTNSQVFEVAISNEECTVTLPVNVNVVNDKEDFIVSGNSTICKGNSITLTSSGLAKEFIWSGQSIGDSAQNTIIVKPTKTSTFIVKAWYPDGCVPQREVKVTVDESVNLDFDFAYKYACNKPSEVVFTNNSVGAKTYSWKFGDEAALESTPSLTLKNNLNTQVLLQGFSESSCVFQFSKKVDLNAYDGKIPNVITPNNDKKNDTFVVGYPPCSLQIFDNWGKKIYENYTYQNDWGNNIKGGAYYYLLTIPNGQTCKGWLEVIN
jgi:gliding motility-associated-like protein